MEHAGDMLGVAVVPAGNGQDVQLGCHGVRHDGGRGVYSGEVPHLPEISIDYGVCEKAQNVYVLPADFGWSDLGTWGSLYDLSEKDEQKNVTLHCEAMYYESESNVVTLESGKLAVIAGLKDMIVAESDGVLLICPKDHEQNIRNIVTEVTEKYGGKYS